MEGEAVDNNVFKKEYLLVRIKKIYYRRQPTFAIFFQNMTKHVD